MYHTYEVCKVTPLSTDIKLIGLTVKLLAYF